MRCAGFVSDAYCTNSVVKCASQQARMMALDLRMVGITVVKGSILRISSFSQCTAVWLVKAAVVK